MLARLKGLNIRHDVAEVKERVWVVIEQLAICALLVRLIFLNCSAVKWAQDEPCVAELQ